MKTFVVAMRKVYTACIYEGKWRVTLRQAQGRLSVKRRADGAVSAFSSQPSSDSWLLSPVFFSRPSSPVTSHCNCDGFLRRWAREQGRAVAFKDKAARPA